MFVVGYLLIMVISFEIAYFLRLSLGTKVVILAGLMAVFAFFVVPDVTSRIDALPYLSSLNDIRAVCHSKGIAAGWKLVHSSRQVSDTSSLAQTMTFSGTPMMAVIMLVFSYLPNPLFLAVIAFVDYFFVLKAIQLVVVRNRLSHQIFAYAYLMFMALIVYTNAVGGIRNNMVGTVYGYFVLKYFMNDNRLISMATLKMVLLTFILAMIHPFTLLLFLILAIVTLFARSWRLLRVSDAVMMLHRFFQQTFFTLLTPFKAIPFVGSILFKSNQYIGDNATLFISSRANWVRDFARLVIMFAIIFALRKFSRRYIDRRYFEFVLLLICFTIGAVQDQVLFERCLLVLLPIMTPYITLLPVVLKKTAMHQPNHLALHYTLILGLALFAFFCLVDNLRAGELYYTFLFNSNPLVTGF